MYCKKCWRKDTNDKSNYKQIFANSWIYNTSSRFQVGISSATFTFNTPIDRASLKIGDRFQILKEMSKRLSVVVQLIVLILL